MGANNNEVIKSLLKKSVFFRDLVLREISKNLSTPLIHFLADDVTGRVDLKLRMGKTV